MIGRLETTYYLILDPTSSKVIEWQVFCFLEGQILQFSAIVIFTVFWDFMQCFLRNAMSESAEISRVSLSITHWQINYEVFVKFSEQFDKSEIFNYEFLLEYILKTSQKCCFPRFSAFSILYSITVIFLCFLYLGKFTTLVWDCFLPMRRGKFVCLTQKLPACGRQVNGKA